MITAVLLPFTGPRVCLNDLQCSSAVTHTSGVFRPFTGLNSMMLIVRVRFLLPLRARTCVDLT